MSWLSSVALLARAWIEMFCWLVLGVLVVVALLARAWIEIPKVRSNKSMRCVALLARAWIEIRYWKNTSKSMEGRSPCESVD